MAEIATTEIRHGGKDGQTTVFAVGEVVKGLTDDEMGQLRLAGVVEKEKKSEPAGKSVEELEAEVAALQSHIAELTSTNVPTPGKAAEDLAKADAAAKAANNK